MLLGQLPREGSVNLDSEAVDARHHLHAHSYEDGRGRSDFSSTHS